MAKKLKIVTWNANGLHKHLSELRLFLHNENIDLCLISESHNTKETYINIEGYQKYNANHPQNKARGGVTIFVKNNIKHHEYSRIELEELQVITVSVKINNKDCTISSIYCPPRYNLQTSDFTDLMQTLGPCFILGGDFNAKHPYWGSRLTSPKGSALLRAGRFLKCNFHSGNKPTHWPTDPSKIPDIIDFFVTKGINKNHVEIRNSNDLTSDHSPVIMTVSDNILVKPYPPELTNKNTDWNHFRNNITESVDISVSLKTSYEIENELESLMVSIQEAAWKSTPKNTKCVKTSSTEEVRNLIKEKRKARKKWQNCRTTENKNKLNQLCNNLKQMLKNNEQTSLHNRLKNLTARKDTDYSLWKTTKQLCKSSLSISPIKRDDGTWAKSAKDKTILFADYLEDTFKPLPSLTTDENINTTNKIDLISIPLVTMKEIKALIKNEIMPNKAPGYDLITGKILKELPEKGIRKLLYIINASFRLQCVPTQWKVAEVIMIPKPGKPAIEKKSYRPISLLPTMSKIFEKLLLKRLNVIIEDRCLIPNHQFGFRSKHSTVEQVHRVTNEIEKSFDASKICSGVFIDVAQAFDKVWHCGLNYKLYRDLPNQFSKILQSYIANRYFRVKCEDEYSKIRKITAGVPQGSVLGPTLYILFTRDIPTPPEAKIATFADDTVILVTGSTIQETTTKLQLATDDILNWTKMWRIKLNETKSVHVNFTNKKINNLPIYMNGSVVPYANTAKYLGFTLDAKLKWKEHVKKKVEELKINLRKMNWLFSPNSGLTLQNKLLLYQQILKPKWTYGSQIWGCTAKTNLNLIQTFQNKVLRQITNCPWYARNSDIHRDLHISTVKEEIKYYAQKHALRLQQHSNAELQEIIRNPMQQRRLRRIIPTDLVM